MVAELPCLWQCHCHESHHRPDPDAVEEAGQGGGRGAGRRTARAHRRKGPRNVGAHPALKAADTSSVIAAFASWHESHEVARRALNDGLRLVEHCALETHCVLARFPQPFLRLGARAYKVFIFGLPDHGVTGGAAYDALVAATAAGCGAELVTCDRRALPIHERYGVRTRLLP